MGVIVYRPHMNYLNSQISGKQEEETVVQKPQKANQCVFSFSTHKNVYITVNSLPIYICTHKCILFIVVHLNQSQIKTTN